jgi:hypothetical protein
VNGPTAELMPALVAAGVFLLVLLVGWSLRAGEGRERRNAPFADDFLRSPGQSLRPRVEAAARRLAAANLFAGSWPLLVFLGWATAVFLLDLGRRDAIDLAAVVLLLAGTLLALVRMRGAETEFRRLRLLLDGDIAAGQSLAELLRQGARVVHDVSVPGFRINHVVVAPSGVFAVRTLTRRRGGRGRGKEDVTVYVQGDELRFPDGVDLKSVPRARKAAQLLADRLREPVGRAVEVRPVLALPGWFVDSRSATDVPVVNPRDAGRLLAGARVLDDRAIDGLVDCLEVIGPAPARGATARDPLKERKEPRLE